MKHFWMSLTLMLPCVAFAASADDLLKQVQESSRAMSRQNEAREQRFLKNRDEQAELLRQAEAELAGVKARADRIKAGFDGRQKEITELKNRLQLASGDLTQLFSVARQAATDFRASAADSLVSAQYPERIAFLDTLAKGSAVPGMAELEQFWFVLQQEITENGKVSRFSSSVVDADGVARPSQVVRVGSFTAFADDKYLSIVGGGTQLAALTPQPGGGYADMAEDFADSGGNADILIDPSRGALLAIESQKPSLFDRLEQGGVVGYVIMVIGVVGLLLALAQLAYLSSVNGRMRRQLGQAQTPTADNPLGRVLAVYRQLKTSEDAELMELHLSEAVLKETPRLERFQSLLKLFTAVAPLLGLLGTVTGMIVTFQVITAFGTGDPKLMAGGISQALVTTVQGLVVAIPILFLNTLLMSRSRALVQILDEQSAGLIARRLESARA
ncbi:MAG: MotA/TolQ/ExbB proton channel family protein [Pseudomonadota bacterium]